MNTDILKIILGNYEEISTLLKEISREELVNCVSGIFNIDKEILQKSHIGLYSKGRQDDAYKFAVEDLIRNTDKYDWVYNHLEDEISREIFTNLVRYRIIPDTRFMKGGYDIDKPQYFDKGIINCDENNESITFIKMDVEGDEIQAIISAKNHITNDYPKLAIYVHQIISDIWEIPMLLHIIRPDYKYYLRHFEKDENWETILYAIPKSQEHTVKKIKRVVAMAPYERPWSNVELIKDCGMIPYLLYKNHGCDVSMVGAGGGEYPYARFVKGMKLEFLEDGKVMTKVQYIMENGKDIDCLILRGCYSTNFAVALAYKTVNPHGRIYVGLDANSDWMDRIIWYNADFTGFMNNCDVIATSCTAMQNFLNEKWPWKIECIPNGYYDLFEMQNKKICFEDKEDIILTVGRLGTSQKATEVLLEAFAIAAEQIPGWKLKLVGTIENSFYDYINEFFKRNPLLSDRVIFTGSIEDRMLLQHEYKKSKIFALTSTLEGGTPNVIAEALWAGCVTAVTQFDAYEDAIGYGNCGKSAPIGDVQGFAQVLLELCMDNKLEMMSEKALEHAENFYDMEKIVGGLYEQLCL